MEKLVCPNCRIVFVTEGYNFCNACGKPLVKMGTSTGTNLDEDTTPGIEDPSDQAQFETTDETPKQETMKFSKIANEDLYQMCLQGNEDAWRYVYNFVLAIVRKTNLPLRDALEDLAQDIVCRLIERIGRVKEPKAFRGFIKRVAINFILDQVRGRRPGLESIDARNLEDGRREVPEPISENPGPEDLMLGSSLLQILRGAVDRLGPRCRKAVTAYLDYKAGVYANYEELAKALGKSIGTLSAQIKRCIDKLRRADGLRQWLQA